MTEKEVLFKMEAYCSIGEHCIDDVNKKMDMLGVPADQRQNVISILLEQRYIDEQRYADAYVHDKINFAKWGKVKIAAMLRMKKISLEIIDNAFDTIDDDDYIRILKEVIESKSSTIKGRTPYEKSMKLIKSVASRGFEIPLIKQNTEDCEDILFPD